MVLNCSSVLQLVQRCIKDNESNTIEACGLVAPALEHGRVLRHVPTSSGKIQTYPISHSLANACCVAGAVSLAGPLPTAPVAGQDRAGQDRGVLGGAGERSAPQHQQHQQPGQTSVHARMSTDHVSTRDLQAQAAVGQGREAPGNITAPQQQQPGQAYAHADLSTVHVSIEDLQAEAGAGQGGAVPGGFGERSAPQQQRQQQSEQTSMHEELSFNPFSTAALRAEAAADRAQPRGGGLSQDNPYEEMDCLLEVIHSCIIGSFYKTARKSDQARNIELAFELNLLLSQRGVYISVAFEEYISVVFEARCCQPGLCR